MLRAMSTFFSTWTDRRPKQTLLKPIRNFIENEMLLGTRESSNFVFAKFACSKKHPTVQFEYSEQGSAKHCRLSRWRTGDALFPKRSICKPVAAQRFSSHGSLDASETKFSKYIIRQKRKKRTRRTHVSSDAQGWSFSCFDFCTFTCSFAFAVTYACTRTCPSTEHSTCERTFSVACVDTFASARADTFPQLAYACISPRAYNNSVTSIGYTRFVT